MLWNNPNKRRNVGPHMTTGFLWIFSLKEVEGGRNQKAVDYNNASHVLVSFPLIFGFRL